MCDREKLMADLTKKEIFFWTFMLRRLFSVFRDEKIFFLNFFCNLFFEFRSLLTHSCFLFRQIISLWTGSTDVCIISLKNLTLASNFEEGFFDVHPSESQCVPFVLAQLKDLF